MKKIFLMGDSIRQGYDRYVKESMANLAEVYYPGENCRFAEYTLRNIHNWKDDLGLDHADAVHWNVGHWDTIRIYGDEPLTRPEVFADYIKRINERIRFLFPEAKIIFATSTPVRECDFIEEFEMRYNRDVEKFNNIAIDVLKPQGVIINDLYSLMKDTPDSYHSDQTHYYTAEATELMGGAVNRVLCKALDLDEKNLITPDKNNFVRNGIPTDKEAYVKVGHLYEKKK